MREKLTLITIIIQLNLSLTSISCYTPLKIHTLKQLRTIKDYPKPKINLKRIMTIEITFM